MKKIVLSITGIVIIVCAFAFRKRPAPGNINKVGHVVVIYMENHSFDNLYGQFPGADGLSDAKQANIIQLDANGQPYATLPPIPRSSAFPTNLPNDIFNIDQYVPADQSTPDVTHAFYMEQ